MPYTATVTRNNVVLPNGVLHQSGDTVTISDADYNQMGTVLIAAVLSGVTPIGDVVNPAPGADGKTVLNGSGAPSGGNNGDFYLNTATTTLYGPKAAGAWPAGVPLIGTGHTSATKTGNYTLTTSNEVILADATGAAITLTLPTAVGNTNMYVAKKTDSTINPVTVATTSAQTIDGAAQVIIFNGGDSVRVVSDGANWRQV